MRAQGAIPKLGVAVSGYPFRPAPALLPAVVTLVYPLCTLIPPTYDWRMRSRIHRRYKGLQAIEDALKATSSGEFKRHRGASRSIPARENSAPGKAAL